MIKFTPRRKRILIGFLFLFIGLLCLGVYLYHETIIPDFESEQIIAFLALTFMMISHRLFKKKKESHQSRGI